MATLSLVVITRNEEDNLAECLDSAAWCDEIVVVDDDSTDSTREVARRYTDKVHRRTLDRFGRQKQFAIEQATGDWILVLDADERVTDELADGIRQVVEADGAGLDGYRLRRLTWLFGEPVSFAGWYKCVHLRLFRRGSARYVDRRVHEYPELINGGKLGALPGHLDHHTYVDLDEMESKRERYSSLAAADWYDAGRRVNGLTAVWWIGIVPLAAFVREFVVQGGWRGGRTGLRIARMAMLSDYVTVRKLWALSRAAPADGS
ncbi:MAG TPA: glycosyltransferase family 2 protein [Acidobacteriota bacterium]|nr:glycosyltransferase family 2 protein [Acidobacteriota bacterium]